MKPYCLGCAHCRPLGGLRGLIACHYYLDTGNKPQYDDDGCESRHVIGEAERQRLISQRRTTGYVSPQTRRAQDDYIFDSRGALDGWMPRWEE